MKIAMMVRGYMTAPKPADIIYAPIDLAVIIARGLASRGHEVTFFAPTGSSIDGVTIRSLDIRPLVNNQTEFSKLVHNIDWLTHYVPQLWDVKLATAMFDCAELGEYDLLYFHHPEIALPLAVKHLDVPVAYTLNDPLDGWYRQAFEMFHSPNQHLISISNNQRRGAPDLPFAQTVYNGVDTKLWEFSEEHEDYLIIAGRIVPEKGFREAIKIAQQTNHRLLIIGPTYEDHQNYFDDYIKPYLNDKILYLGSMDQAQLAKYYQKAKAFLMPVQWEEPFGQTMVEAMSCGTPVIALRRGSVPEIIVDGKTGFIRDSISEMAEAVGQIDSIKRRDCRKHVEQHFSAETMVDGYEKTFKDILLFNKQTTPPSRLVKSRLKRLPHKIKSRLKKLK
ncbi:MAG: glycosyltransferase family 4 protein [Candidatus Saccharimonadales bacterium]